MNVTRDCVADENCIVPNLVFPTGVHDLRSISTRFKYEVQHCQYVFASPIVFVLPLITNSIDPATGQQKTIDIDDERK